MIPIIIGLPMEICTGRRLDVTHLLKANKGKYIGAYGKVTAYEWRIEQQTGGALHAHGNLYGSGILMSCTDGFMSKAFAIRL